MGTSVGKLYRNKIVKDLAGNIIDWYDEARGGWIVNKRTIVNKELWNEYLRKEQDKREAAKAITMQKVDVNAPDRTGSPSQLESMKKEMADLRKDVDDKFKAILEAIKK